MTGSAAPIVGRVGRSLQGYACEPLGAIHQAICATGLVTASFGIDASVGSDRSDPWRREQMLHYRDRRSVFYDNRLFALCSNSKLVKCSHLTETARGFANFANIPRLQNTSNGAIKDGVPLLRHPPNLCRVPRITLESCPDVQSLAAHIEMHGSQYELKDVQAGFQVLAQLAPNARSPSAIASGKSQTTIATTTNSTHSAITNIMGQTASSTSSPTSNPIMTPITTTTTRPVSNTHPEASAQQCARRLAHLGQFLMRKEVAKHDIGAIAGCIRALAEISQEAYSENLVLPFLLWLRDPRSIFMMHTIDPAALIAVLHALAVLRPRLQWTPANRGPFGMVIRRVSMGIIEQASELSIQDTIAVIDGIARLNLDVRGRDVTIRVMQVLADHTCLKLLPENQVRPDEAVQLLYLYGNVLPGAATVASESSSSSSPSSSSSSSSPSSSSPRTSNVQRSRSKSSTSVSRHESTDVHVPEVAALVPKLSDLVCRARKSFQPHELVRLVRALAALGARVEAQSALPWLTPVFLENLERLEQRALVNVAHGYHVLAFKEPGLIAAIGQQIAASGGPLHDRHVRKLMPCFGVGGTVKDVALWAMLRQHLRDGVERIPVHVLEKLRGCLNPKDSADAEVLAAIDVRLSSTSPEAAIPGKCHARHVAMHAV